MLPAPVARRFFPPAVALHAVKIACELPDPLGRSLSPWDCQEIARQWVIRGVVESISAETVRRIRHHHKLKPWRQHLGLSPKVPRDEAFCTRVWTLCEGYTRPLGPHEKVLCIDEKTSLQPRPRQAPTRPAGPNPPVRVEHEDKRQGALNLFAGFDTRTGQVYGQCHERKRPVEFIPFLDRLDRDIPAQITLIHVVLDNLRMPKGKQVQAWLAAPPRFRCYPPPVHGSWMNQGEQWFRILQRKRVRMADFAVQADRRDKLMAFIAEYHQHAHPFKWTTKSVAKVMAKVESSPLPVAA